MSRSTWVSDVDEENLEYLLSLLDNTVYDQRKKDRYESEIKNGLTVDSFDRLMNLFLADRVDPVTHRGIYGMKELGRHLDKLQ